MNKDTIRKELYQVGYDYLLALLPHEQAEEILIDNLDLADGSQKHVSSQELYKGILVSAQNTRGKPNQISKSIGGFDKLSMITSQFDPIYVSTHYTNWQEVFSSVKNVLKPTGAVYESPSGVWPKYCKTMLSAAMFMSKFKDGKDFFEWANILYQDSRSQDGLPLLIAHEVFGVKYALACDFLKDKGFLNFGKPDTHVQDILRYVGLCDEYSLDFEFQKEIRAIALANQKTSYNVDRLIWLLGSGDFSKSKDGIKLAGKSKKSFLEFWSQRRGGKCSLATVPVNTLADF